MEQTPAPDNRQSLARGALRHTVVKQLLTDIMRGEIAAGSRLWAKDIAARLGVSVTPIREAFLELQLAGMVHVLHNRGTLVNPFGREQLQEIFELRQLLETAATRGACRCIDAQWLKQGQKQLLALLAEKTWDEACLQQAAVLDQQLHQTITERTRNRRLAHEIHRHHSLMLQTLCEIINSREELARPCLDAQRSIYEALLEGDVEGAGKAMDNHIVVSAAAAEKALFP